MGRGYVCLSKPTHSARIPPANIKAPSGAGNWFSPQELTTTGIFMNSLERTTTERDPGVENTTDSRSRGRGGAGNFVWSSEADEAAKREAEAKEQEIKANIEKDVEVGLAMPGRAVLRRDGLKD